MRRASPDTRKRGKQPRVCKHPPAALWAWYAQETLCVCCCDCGAVLRGGVTLQGDRL